ncbi:hypothetical protein [Azospirillum canadense]|uniref:hypothetical protein n=1 Tax=Azospirillum canadense TaxID=403962 RepID=UPI002227D891|nr:hypothetical protein [Azospirillum canadense]MCW2240908.1 hypothetical protein [Azospirillum canadense]
MTAIDHDHGTSWDSLLTLWYGCARRRPPEAHGARPRKIAPLGTATTSTTERRHVRLLSVLGLAVGLAMLVASGVSAQQLPPAPGKPPVVRRNADGEIVVLPPPKITAAPQVKAQPAALPAAEAPPVYATPPVCAPKALTCIEAVGGSQAQRHVPLTVGQPFRAGDVPKGASLIAEDSRGGSLPVQIDQPATFADESLRFAVLSTVLPSLPAHGREIVNFFVGTPAGGTGTAVPTPDTKIEAVASVYAAQVSLITFGNRAGLTPGVPFLTGEQVTIALGDAPEDRYTLTISPDMAGGAHPTLRRIAETFLTLINQGRSFRAYKLGEGGGYENLWVTTREQPGRAFRVRFLYTGQAHLRASVLQEWQPSRRFVASAKAGDTAHAWLSGSVVSETTQTVPFVEEATGTPHPQLTARFAVRAYAGVRAVRVDTTVENAWTHEPGAGNLSYDMALLLDGAEAFRIRNVTHYHHARWHTVRWAGEAPTVHVRHNAPYLFKSRAVWNYNTRVAIPEAVLAAEEQALARADTGPMGAATITTYMPMTGGRSDIGPLPRWTALYLLTQDRRAKALMLANADAGGGAPIHFRDRQTDQPISLERHPNLFLVPGQPGPDAIPAMSNADTPWAPDVSHQPSLAYVPYLVTGDKYYLDELMFWANWTVGVHRPEYRGGGLGLLTDEQIRGQAWGLRGLGEAAHALPDRHPMKGYFARILANNLGWYVNTYPRNPDRLATSPLGWVEKNDAIGVTGPWQNDFLAIVIGWLAETGEPLAAEYFRWLSRATVGRWTHEAHGYCRAQAPAYYIKIRGPDNRFIADWGELHRLNWPEVRGCSGAITEGFPNAPTGYVAVSLAMLAVAADQGVDGAAAAYNRLRQDTAMTFATDPTWAIVPRQSTDSGGPHGVDAAVR